MSRQGAAAALPIAPVYEGVTFGDITARVDQLRAGWPAGAEMREIATLFAMLKVGAGIQKLVWFTNYDRPFLVKFVEELRSHGLLFTGVPSVQFLLKQCPGAEDLIERITGAPVRRVDPDPAAVKPSPAKGVPTMSEKNAPAVVPAPDPPPAAPAGDQCSPTCDKPVRHKGRCKGTVVPRGPGRTKPAPLALVAEPAAASSARTAEKPASVAPTSKRFSFSIYCYTNGSEYRSEGDTHDGLQGAMQIVGLMLGEKEGA